MASVFYLLCADPGCRNEARYFEQVAPGVIYLRWCGIHDILRNGGMGKTARELHFCSICPAPAAPTSPRAEDQLAFFTAEELAAHEQGPQHRSCADVAAYRSKNDARRSRRGEGRRR